VCEDRDFVDAVQGGPNRIRAPYAEALKTHRLATEAARSARERRPISLARSAGMPEATSA
jgi:predicted dehydrogenase